MRIKREEKKKAEELFALYDECPIQKENFFIDELGPEEGAWIYGVKEEAAARGSDRFAVVRQDGE